jgi:Arc/MetJ-type ribon-helix-helix transcriptional regulator
MPSTLNISLTDEQKGWLNSRREAGGFASSSDVVRDLIRSRQEQERESLLKEFQRMET